MPQAIPLKDPADFFQTLRQQVNAYFEDNQIKKTANGQMYVKTVVILLLYFVPYLLMLLQWFPDWTAIGWYLLMGVGLSGIGLSIMHDAVHGAYSNVKWVNQLLGYSMNLIGGSSFTWKIQHNVLHHTYTNIYEKDEDIDDKPFLRLSPFGKWETHHRFQHIYAVLLYGLGTISWVFLKDFRQLAGYNRSGMTEKSGANPKTEMAVMIFSKVAYLFYTVALPIMLGVAGWAVAIGFVLMHVLAGIFITTIFQLAHVVEGPDHHHTHSEAQNPNSWAIDQLRSTANFARKNRLITWFVGGLNFQIEHHLFPKICHIHYQKISDIVRQTVKEYGLPYHEYPYFTQALQSHIRTLKMLGQGN